MFLFAHSVWRVQPIKSATCTLAYAASLFTLIFLSYVASSTHADLTLTPRAQMPVGLPTATAIPLGATIMPGAAMYSPYPNLVPMAECCSAVPQPSMPGFSHGMPTDTSAAMPSASNAQTITSNGAAASSARVDNAPRNVMGRKEWCAPVHPRISPTIDLVSFFFIVSVTFCRSFAMSVPAFSAVQLDLMTLDRVYSLNNSGLSSGAPMRTRRSSRLW